MASPLQVGVTGGIGSGKSLVCSIFKCLGVPIYDADSRAKALMTTDGILIGQIRAEFGDLAYTPDGKLDRAYLSRQTFGQPEALKRLNSLVHPRVAEDYRKWVSENSGAAYLIREAALLYEAGAWTTVDKMVVVSAPEDIRVKRVTLRDPQRSSEQIRAIIQSQWPEEEKIKRADFVIHNDDQHMVIPQVLALHRQFTA